MKTKIGITKLTIPHEGGELTFAHPAYKGTRAQVEVQINKSGLVMPTSAQTASLVYDSWKNPKGQYEAEIIQILKESWIWEREGNLYLAKNSGAEVHDGVIIANPDIINGRMIMDRSKLIQKLQEGDESVRFVPNGARFNEKYLVARYGEEGADKIHEIAENYKKGLKTWILDSVNEDVQKMSALDDSWGLDSSLCVYGNVWDGYNNGRALGVIDFEKSR